MQSRRISLDEFIDAARDGKISIVQQYIEENSHNPAAVNAVKRTGKRTGNGLTALMMAAYRGHTDIVRALLNAGANVNTTTSWGETALTYAALQRHTDVVQVLLAAPGIDLNLSTQGQMAADIAKSTGRMDIHDLIMTAKKAKAAPAPATAAAVVTSTLTAEEHFNEGRNLQKQEKYDAAIKHYNETIRLKPDYHAAYLNRGYCHNKIGKHTEAIADNNEVIKSDSGNSIPYNNRGFAYFNLGDFDKAIDDYQKALLLNPDFHEDFHEAKKHLEDAKQAAAEAHFNEGVKLQDQTEYTKAIKHYNEAIRLRPDNRKAYACRGYCYSKSGNYTEAISNYNKAVQLDSGDYVSYYNCGLAYSKLGEFDKAIYNYKKALRLKPDDQKIKEALQDAEKTAANKKVTTLNQRANDAFAALNQNGKPASELPDAIIALEKQEEQLLASLLELIQKSGDIDVGAAKNMTTAINHWRHYPRVARSQPAEEIPSITPYVADYLRRKEAVNRYISEIKQHLLDLKNCINITKWEIQHWLTGKPIAGTPNHITLINQQLTRINEHSNAESILETYTTILKLLSKIPKSTKRRLAETQAFYDMVTLELNQIMFNLPEAPPPTYPERSALNVAPAEAPPSYDAHMQQEAEQHTILKNNFPDYEIQMTTAAYFLTKKVNPGHPIIINKNQFHKDVKDVAANMRIAAAPVSSSIFSPAESAALTAAATLAAAAAAAKPVPVKPTFSSSSSRLFALKPAALPVDDTVTAAELARRCPAVPNHRLPGVIKTTTNNTRASRQMMRVSS